MAVLKWNKFLYKYSKVVLCVDYCLKCGGNRIFNPHEVKRNVNAIEQYFAAVQFITVYKVVLA